MQGMNLLVVLTSSIIFLVSPVSSQKAAGAELTVHLLKNIRRTVRPVLHSGDDHDHNPVTVIFGMKLLKLIGLEETTQELSSKFWVRMSWCNGLMKWNSSEWNDIRQISVNAERVWTPDIVLYNDVHAQGGLDMSKAVIGMQSNGRHSLMLPITFHSSCKVNAGNFPFDTQTCKQKFGSWTFNNHKVALQAPTDSIVGPIYVPSSEWDIVDTDIQKNSVVYEGYGDVPYDDVTISVKISRKETSYMFYMVGPCLILVGTTLFSFSLPPDSGERMTVVVTNLLCFALFMLMTTEVLPQSSDHIPIISVFYMVLMVESCLSIFMACCVLTVYYRGKQESPPQIPPWLLKLFLKLYAKCCKTDTTAFSSKLPVMKSIRQQVGLLLAIGRPGACESYASMNLNGVELKETSPSESSKVGNWSSLPSDLNNRIITLPQKDQPELTNILSELRSITAISKKKREHDALRVDWEFIGYMLDRLYFRIFMALVIISTTCILASAYHKKEHAIIPLLHQNIQPDNHDDSALYFGTAC